MCVACVVAVGYLDARALHTQPQRPTHTNPPHHNTTTTSHTTQKQKDIGPPSHLLWNLKVPLLRIMSVVAGVVAYTKARATCCTYLPSLAVGGNSIQVYQLGSFALSLLLVRVPCFACAGW